MEIKEICGNKGVVIEIWPNINIEGAGKWKSIRGKLTDQRQVTKWSA